MEQAQLETVSELVYALGGDGNDDPVYVRTPHGTYYFVVQDVETAVVEGEKRTVIVVREVDWPKCDFPRDAEGNKTGEGCAVHGRLDLVAGQRCPHAPGKVSVRTGTA